MANMSALQRRPLLSTMILLSALAGCGGDGNGGGGAGDNGGGSNGSGTGGNGSGACAQADEVVAPTVFSEGSVIYRMALDGDDLYFASLDRLFRVPVSGGTPEELYFRDLAIAVPFFVRENDILILEGDALVSLPKNGGETRIIAMLPEAPTSGLDGSVALLFDGAKAYYETSSGGFGDEPEMVSFYALDLESGTSTLLTTSDAIRRSSNLVKAGDGLYASGRDPSLPPPADDDFSPQPSALYRIPTAGGAPEIVTTEFDGSYRFAFGPMGGDESAVFLAASPVVPEDSDDFSALSLAGIYRLPIAGGTATQVIKAFVVFSSNTEHDRVGDQNFIRVVGTSDDVYSLPVGGDAATKRFCVSGGDSHAMAVNNDAAYVAMYDSETEASRIVRVDL